MIRAIPALFICLLSLPAYASKGLEFMPTFYVIGALFLGGILTVLFFLVKWTIEFFKSARERRDDH